MDRRHAGAALVVLGLLLISVTVLVAWAPETHRVKAPEERMLRLHVLANSDSAADQALKRRVRDAVVAALAPELQGAPDAADVQARLAAHLGGLARTAQAEVRAAGYTYQVRVELGRFAFDERRLGRIRVPPGSYPALRVLIGDAAGQNWWCLLFPPLCFAGGAVAGPLLPEPGVATAAPGPAAAASGPATVAMAPADAVLLPGPARGTPLLMDDGDMAPEARWALLDWLREQGIRVERLGRQLRLWLDAG